MPHPKNKIPGYIENRIAGLDPQSAALAMGYAKSGLAVTVCRLEKRADVIAAVRKAKRGGVGKRVVTETSDDDPKKLDPWKLKDRYSNPLELLLDVMNNKDAPGGLRIQCAKDAMPYMHARKESSKREEKDSKAKETHAKSRFTTQPTPLRRAA